MEIHTIEAKDISFLSLSPKEEQFLLFPNTVHELSI
jgi:hypothetical protein